MMRFIDWFAGIGGFRKGMEEAGHKCVGFCEIDKYAYMSYVSMHLLNTEQRNHLASMPLKQRQKEIMKDEYRNGEWFAADVSRVYPGDIPDAECWCFGFPCQDISICGSGIGFKGNRSSLFFRIIYLLEQLPEEKKPRTLLIENVKNLLGVNGGWDFARLLIALDRGGYDAEWQVLNSKDFGVPQNRERCFVIGHIRTGSGSEVFPIQGTTGQDSSCRIHQVGSLNNHRKNPNPYRVYDVDGLSPTINKMDGGGREPHIITPQVACIGGVGQANFGKQFHQQDRIYDDGIATALSSMLPGGANYYGLKTDIQTPDAIWSNAKQCYISIRKLTPKECFRLQGWKDDYFEKAQFVNSDHQLYKQSGNGVTVPVIKAIAEKLQ